MRETELYGPIKAYLQGQGYEVKGEVDAADIVARRGTDPLVVVELKTGFSLSLFHQAVARLAVTDAVYVGVPKPKTKAGKDNVALARRLGLGVIFVRPRDGLVEVVCDPGPYHPRKSPKKTQRLLRAFERLRGDPNDGGATRHGLVTGYRQDAIAIARFLAVHGASKASHVSEWTEIPQARQIMADNHYGWFLRASRGVYDLSPAGRQGLADWGVEADPD